MSKKSHIASAVMLGGGAAIVGAVYYAFRKSSATAQATKDAVAAGGVFDANLTHYYPFESGLTAAQRKMEGAPVDRKGQPLHTVEDFLAGNSDHVSIAADPEIFPYGQKLLIPWGNQVLVGRTTDTGGHFHGAGKVYRVTGREPLDVCVLSKDNHPPKSKVSVKIVAGDSFEKGKAVATSKFKDQTVAGDYPRSTADRLRARKYNRFKQWFRE